MSTPVEKSEGVGSQFAKVAEVAEYLNISTTTVYALMEKGELSYVRIMGSRRIPWDEVHRLVRENTVTAR